MKIIIRSVKEIDKDWLVNMASSQTGPEVLSSGSHLPSESPGFIAQIGDEKVGIISYAVSSASYAIIMISSSRHGLGIGRALVNSVIMEAKDTNRSRVTATAKTSDASTLEFFKGCGFTLASVKPGNSGTTSRIAGIANVGISTPVPEEIELEFKL